jgi:hypothetical protein
MRAGRTFPGGTPSGVSFDILHDDHDLPGLGLGDRVPDGQAVRRKIEPVGARHRVVFGKWVGKRRDRLLQEVKDCLVRSVPKWLRQSSSSSQVLSGKRKTRSVT